MCSLTDGNNVYITIKNGSDFEFEEGGSYVVKNYTLSQKYGRPCLFITRETRKFRTAPLAVAELAEKAAKEALYPPSQCMTGEEEDIFTNTGHLSLKGKIEKVQVARMTRAQTPILDLSLRCGAKLHEVSLWRDEALVVFYVGDQVELTHLKSNIRPNGKGKFDSSNYTRVKIVERQIDEAELLIIGVSEDENKLILLDNELEEYNLPSHFYSGSVNDLLEQLPIKMKVQHINRHVLNIQSLETESLDPIGAAESLNLTGAEESLDQIQDIKSLDPVKTAESLDPVTTAESLDQDDLESLALIESMEAEMKE
ncbi:hypothetical protein DPX16_0275 [Anabarilius grahami]|uniref:Uncharacterized protein n=1 Tax=Anabarilius grahami TaxID=495550 RepID=A0A3N0Z1P0_ANAGA|nr:hypothetical protein DPX16_0275 [Anabarilius grahami]